MAIVGAGTMARHHARAISGLSDTARVCAVADPVEEARSELLALCPEATGYTTLERLLESEHIDVVHVCAPPALHFTLSRTALEAGCNVYVEKPFTETSLEAQELIRLADRRGLSVCAGHQLLFEAPTRRALELASSLGRIVHVESYFAFRPVRRARGGGPAMRTEQQLLDVLPHPAYLLLAFLKRAAPDAETRLAALELGRGGSVHALVRRGDISGNLVVTLEGRPIESYVRLVGSNGTVHADFVRGTVQRQIGPGSSGIDKALNPFRLSRQLWTGTFAALSGRILKRSRSYPGLGEILTSFYDAIRSEGPPPMGAEDILSTVEICEQIAERIDRERRDVAEARTDEAAIAVTGGTGFLGRAVVRHLSGAGIGVRAIARREPSPWDRVPGVDYTEWDLGSGVDPAALAGCRTVIHCAAETAGGWPEHQRNSLDATEHLMRSAAAAGVAEVIHVSSLAVLEPRRGEAISEDSPPVSDPRGRGPYVWGKAESENLARRLGDELGVRVKVVRPGAIVDYSDLDPPGRLGRRLGNVLVAVGSPRDRLGTTSLARCAETLAWMSQSFDRAPDAINLLDPELPSKRGLVDRLKARNPDLAVVWLPRPVLTPLSWLGVGLQRVLRPGRPPISVAKVFAKEEYDTDASRRLGDEVRSSGSAHLPGAGKKR